MGFLWIFIDCYEFLEDFWLILREFQGFLRYFGNFYGFFEGFWQRCKIVDYQWMAEWLDADCEWIETGNSKGNGFFSFQIFQLFGWICKKL